MNEDLVNRFAMDLARLQRIMAKVQLIIDEAPLDDKVKESHINCFKELADLTTSLAHKAKLLLASSDEYKELADCATQIAQTAGALLPSPDE
jgi:hypothetical protein